MLYQLHVDLCCCMAVMNGVVFVPYLFSYCLVRSTGKTNDYAEVGSRAATTNKIQGYFV